ncbi:hypothetical protein V1508DRAFT_420186 [Lipomyces doorenjongii]|uniref:uncharacterized protein n=1 Tax=Lipomyces doorenjongii TaxID=383834 RepID=UPI0034CD372C
MASAMDIDHDVPTVLSVLRTEAPPDLAGDFYTMEDLWERRLWHQLTDVLVQFFQNPESVPLRTRVYTQFVGTFDSKINQLKLVSLGLATSATFQDKSEALEFMTALAGKVNTPASQDAYVYAQIETAQVKLQIQDLDGARVTLDSAGSILEKFDSVESVINAAYYSVNADYYKAKADFAAYYRNSLRFLACINVTDLTLTAQRERAYDLSVAALLGESIYNFGELLLHPILDSLVGTEYEWLRSLLFVLNAGAISKFDELAPRIATLPILQSSNEFLRQKICLMALIEAVFQRPASDRTLSFHTIATETRLLLEEVEHLVMKALSLGLIRGSIDQVGERVTITWLQPRIMTKDQIESMRQRLLEWDSSVKQLGVWMENSGKDVWAAS